MSSDREVSDREIDAWVIGVGPGNPKQITVEAVDAIRRLDGVILLDKGESTASMRRLRTDLLDEYAPDTTVLVVADPPRDRRPEDYAAEVRRWHAARVDAIAEAVDRFPRPAGRAPVVGFLVWGDPSLYDSTLRLVDALAARPGWAVTVHVVPGVTSASALAAAHAITANRIGRPVHITTGRRLSETAATGEDQIVMLDGAEAFRGAARPDDTIYWGANLGTPDEVLISGPVARVADDISAARADLKSRVGWVMDIYLLRRPDAD
ncbi:precorrin-6A synthase (deacetylating) [Gordonia sp. X0973]|uniref:precorrin-6A synthase (deacetylating) n=1 Tax=Gordonia sp. X0973 TaxID=2742602 RepID=UPI0026575ED3|nr:precorrin-6A synthase (deacetylating) [Gordonia sp. X0973]